MKPHVVIIGAGFAGMAAAYELHTLGLASTVLEARERVGGRVWSTKLANVTAVTAFCGSTQAQQNLATNSNNPKTWLNQLQSANPDLEFVNEPIMVDWSQDDLARGCYSAFDNPATDIIPQLAKPIGRLFFASEYTDQDSATMEGALASGLRAAREVMETVDE